MEISIIVCVYNGEDVIVRCLDSVVNSSTAILLGNLFELIIIDDGSSDNTALLLDGFRNVDGIKIKSISNSGLGAARNLAMTLAHGKYLYFLDADDFLITGGLVSLIQSIGSLDSDSIEFNIKKYTSDLSLKGSVFPEHDPFENLSREDYLLKVDKLRITAWSRFWKRSIITGNNIIFQEGVKFEDIFFAKEFYCKAQTFTYLDIDFYAYVLSEGSLTRKKRFDLNLFLDTWKIRRKNLRQWRKEENDMLLRRLLASEVTNANIKLVKILLKLI